MGTGSTIKTKALRLLPLVLLMLLTLAACRKSEFSPDAKFVDLYVELKLATVGYANNLDKVNEVRRVILAQHHETPATFHSQYIRLMAHPESWRKFQEDVVKQVETFQAAHKVDRADKVVKVVKVDSVKAAVQTAKKAGPAVKIEKGK
jgi:hypothetical protein